MITWIASLVVIVAAVFTPTTTTTLSLSSTRVVSQSRSFLVSAWTQSPQYPNNQSGWTRHIPRSKTTTAFTTGTATTAATTFVTHPHRRTTTSSTAVPMSKSTGAATTDTTVDTPRLTFRDSVQQRIVNSWIQQLDTETTDNYQKSLLESRLSVQDNKNQTKRQVFNGHYVLVAPTPLPNPRLLLYSTDVAEQLGFSSEQIHETSSSSSSSSSSNDNDFVRFVSGHSLDFPTPGWATPYALSIMGTRYTNNCPYGTGNAYGDGRAVSIAEIHTVTDDGVAYELQLKGGGTTPFHRGADGRAVLRSSIREFLASEAMHYLNVPTTRALSLVVSTTATIQRPWYKDQVDNTATFPTTTRATARIPKMDDPRLAEYTIEQRKQIINQIRRQNKEDPDILITEPCAITCRVSPSFVRIGHLDLFARRATKASLKTASYNTESLAWIELEKMIWHACYREYRAEAYTPYIEQKDIAAAATVFLEQSAQKLAHMVAQWIRVGFAQ